MQLASMRRLVGGLLLLSLPACDHIRDPLAPAPLPPVSDLIARDKPLIDPAAVKATNDVLQHFSRPEVPLVTVPPRPNGGLLGEFNLTRADKPTVSPTVSMGGASVGMAGVSAALSDAVDGGPLTAQKVELNFTEMSLRSIIELLFDRYIKRPYTILPDFTDKNVSWVVSGQYDEATLLRMIAAFLDIHGVRLSQQGDIYAISSGQPRATMQPVPIGHTTATWRLTYVDVKDIGPLVRQFITTPDRVQFLDRANLMMVTASQAEISNVERFVQSVDTPALKDRHILIYGPRFLTAQAVVSLLQNLPRGVGLDMSEGKRIVEAEVVPGQQRVVIVTRSPDMRRTVLDYLAKVDQAGKSQRQVFQYALRNQKAADLRQTLEQMVASISYESKQIEVVADVPTNSIFVTATPEQFFEVRKIVERLDFTVPSVLIEAVVVEVQLNENLAYGVEWFLNKKLGSKVALDSTLSLKNDNITKGLNIGVLSLVDNSFAALDLLSSTTNLQVLSRPKVLVKNKQNAVIKSTREIRVVRSIVTTSTTLNGDNLPRRDYESKEVGITLDVTPEILADGSIVMRLKIIDSNQGGTDLSSGEAQPTFDTREVTTEFMVGNGETVFIGGLIKRDRSQEQEKIPALGDVPLLGNLFSNRTSKNSNSELIVLVTPLVVLDRSTARLVTEAMIDPKAKPTPQAQ